MRISNWARFGLIAVALSPLGGCSRGEETLTKEAYYEDGTLKSKTNYVIRDGKEILWGESIDYYPNGQINTLSTFAQGKRHGKYESYYEDGKPRSKGNYAYGNRHGEWTEWDAEGKTSVKSFTNGRDDSIPVRTGGAPPP